MKFIIKKMKYSTCILSTVVIASVEAKRNPFAMKKVGEFCESDQECYCNDEDEYPECCCYDSKQPDIDQLDSVLDDAMAHIDIMTAIDDAFNHVDMMSAID